MSRRPIHIVENPPKDKEGLNVVTNAEVQAFEGYVVSLAVQFCNKNGRHGYTSPANTHQVQGACSFTLDDVKQELRLSVWKGLRNYSSNPQVNFNAQKITYVVQCMKNALTNLANSWWSESKDHAQNFVDRSALITGSRDDDDEAANG